MFLQNQLSQLNTIDGKIISEADGKIILYTPAWESGDEHNKYFTVYTQVFNNYTDFIISLIGRKVKIEYIDDGEYEDIKDGLI